jgi:hypothetical protein
MKKIIVSVLALLILTTTLTSCGNKQWFDTTYKYDRAIISLPNGEVIDSKIDGWTDYEDGDQIQVKINGKTYLVHSSDVVLIAE